MPRYRPARALQGPGQRQGLCAEDRAHGRPWRAEAPWGGLWPSGSTRLPGLASAPHRPGTRWQGGDRSAPGTPRTHSRRPALQRAALVKVPVRPQSLGPWGAVALLSPERASTLSTQRHPEGHTELVAPDAASGLWGQSQEGPASPAPASGAPGPCQASPRWGPALPVRPVWAAPASLPWEGAAPRPAPCSAQGSPNWGGCPPSTPSLGLRCCPKPCTGGHGNSLEGRALLRPPGPPGASRPARRPWVSACRPWVAVPTSCSPLPSQQGAQSSIPLLEPADLGPGGRHVDRRTALGHGPPASAATGWAPGQSEKLSPCLSPAQSTHTPAETTD
nr:collagen alpha-1(I) chain-like [Microcebus murinus]